MKKSEIWIIAYIYSIICFIIYFGIEEHKSKKLYQDFYKAKVIAVELYEENESLYEAVESLNIHIDKLEQNKLLKDLLSIDDRNKAIVLAIAFTESSLRYDVKHNEKWTVGIGGIRPNFYPDLFEDGLNPNSLLAIEKVYLSLMNKFDNDKVSVLKHYKGIKSNSNMYLVHNVLELEKKILDLINF